MIHQQIEQAAEEYLDSADTWSYGLEENHDITAQMRKAFIDGADFALSRQWVSVDDALPEEYDYVLVHIPGLYLGRHNAVSYWDGKDWHTHNCNYIRPDFWMPIPQLTPEKE